MDDSRNQAILTVTAVFLGISLVSVGLRCFVRAKVVQAFGWDDSLMVLAMVLNLVFAICGLVGCKYGLGRTLAYFVVRPEHFTHALLCWWLGQVFYVVTCVVAKLSIIITLLRITVDRIHAWILYAAMSLATAVGVVFFFFTVFQCSPVNYFWHPLSENGKCVDKDVLIGIAYLYSIGAAITDLTIGLLPVALIWNLRMNRRTKGAIVGILGVGCIASAAVIIRIPFVHHYKDREFLYNTYQISIWSNVEAGLGITAGCLTTLRPLVRFLRDGSSPSQAPGPIPLSSSVAPGLHRSSRTKHEDRDDVHQLWTGNEMDDYHGVTTTIMSSSHTKPISSSEEDLTPSNWKVKRSVRMSIRDS
ncbi:hypothetical protein NUU61_005940 [Penicillium alfredii]|uniref:Rhodopsin domain-containing protein n=1 Tax=Penicillium alfredii TaxID=1506179 RepID=A0A9W9EZZ6_9EURO|nr:uncharacterized protein NUU61_005940 [Penicillium alfredii]KAJ5091070.1 hypothetical protein NUU61_005940 [Penicillium alfredii]